MGRGLQHHYWLYEWLFFCEVASRCAGLDLYAHAPAFYRHRAVASMFETLPGVREYGSRRSVSMGDGGGRVFGGDRDKALAARRILAARFPDDPSHQVVCAFDRATPRSAVGDYAYKDFLWRDPGSRAGDLTSFRLSHLSPGAGHVYARSDWGEGATHFFFRCGDRFTAHQHLDVGHFAIHRKAELAGDGGHYDGFGTRHDVNYHLRTIAHSTLLVRDPTETWPRIRAGEVEGNDGGQRHDWSHHNGAVVDVAAWQAGRERYETGEITAFEDQGAWLYVAGDCGRAYAASKLARFVRQIVYVRPGTFVVFDQVTSTRAELPKTWLLQAATVPTGEPPALVVANGEGRLHVRTLLPRGARVRLAAGAELYAYDGRRFDPARDTGPAPACRIEVTPPDGAREDLFLHVLTACDAPDTVAVATLERRGDELAVAVGGVTIRFDATRVGGSIELDGRRTTLTGAIDAPYLR